MIIPKEASILCLIFIASFGMKAFRKQNNR